MAGITGDGHLAAVRLDHRLHERETETEPALGPAPIAAKEAVPDVWLIFDGNADAGVPHGEDACGRALGDGDLDAASGRRVLDRVVDQVGADLHDATAIDVDLDAGDELRDDM